jgi:hypothetical protein
MNQIQVFGQSDRGIFRLPAESRRRGRLRKHMIFRRLGPFCPFFAPFLSQKGLISRQLQRKQGLFELRTRAGRACTPSIAEFGSAFAEAMADEMRRLRQAQSSRAESSRNVSREGSEGRQDRMPVARRPRRPARRGCCPWNGGGRRRWLPTEMAGRKGESDGFRRIKTGNDAQDFFRKRYRPEAGRLRIRL